MRIGNESPILSIIGFRLCVTVNSDDPAYFGGYIAENFLEAQAALGLTRNDIYKLAKNSFNASFLSAEDKQKLVNELDNCTIQPI